MKEIQITAANANGERRVQQQMQNYQIELKKMLFGVSKFNFSMGLALIFFCTFMMYASVTLL